MSLTARLVRSFWCKVAAFDVHETPIVTFVDYGARVDGSGNELNFRALIGVRDDRFTSRQPIFYSNASCTTDPCIAGPSVELYNIGIDGRGRNWVSGLSQRPARYHLCYRCR